MYRNPVRLLTAVALITFVMNALTAHAQQPIVQSEEFSIPASNTFFPLFPLVSGLTYPIHVHHKFSAQPAKVPVLLVHGTWGNATTWDFPGRSVMDYLAVRGYDV